MIINNLQVALYIISGIYMTMVSLMIVNTYFNVREIQKQMENDDMNRAQRRTQARQNKLQPRHGTVNLQTVVKQLNDSLRALDRQGVRIADWDDPDKTLWGFQIKHGRIHYLSVKEKVNDGERISEPSETTQSENQAEP